MICSVGSEFKVVFLKKYGMRNEGEMKKIRRLKYKELMGKVGKVGGKVGLVIKRGDGEVVKLFAESRVRLDLKVKEKVGLKRIEEWVEFGNVEIEVLPVRSL